MRVDLAPLPSPQSIWQATSWNMITVIACHRLPREVEFDRDIDIDKRTLDFGL